MTQKNNKNNTKSTFAQLNTDKKKNVGFSISLLKSNLQKAIRRGNVDVALKSAKLLLHKSPNDFWRRLPIIIAEDVLPHPQLRKMVDLAVKSSKQPYQIKAEDEIFALSIVEQITRCEYRDVDFIYSDKVKKLAVPKNDLPFKENSIIKALEERAGIGGMAGDLAMLKNVAKVYYNKLKSKAITRNKLKSYFPKNTVDYSKITLKENISDILLEAVDFHCSPLLTILLKKKYIQDRIKKEFGDKVDVEELLKNIIWRIRSSVNYKKDITTDKVFDWLDNYDDNFTEKDSEKYKSIYKLIEKEINNIGKWYLGNYSV